MAQRDMVTTKNNMLVKPVVTHIASDRTHLMVTRNNVCVCVFRLVVDGCKTYHITTSRRHVETQRDMTQRDMVQRDMTQRDTTQRDMTQRDMTLTTKNNMLVKPVVTHIASDRTHLMVTRNNVCVCIPSGDRRA